jgi:hypothetical protein
MICDVWQKNSSKKAWATVSEGLQKRSVPYLVPLALLKNRSLDAVAAKAGECRLGVRITELRGGILARDQSDV